MIVQHRLISTGGATPCQYFYNDAGNRLKAIQDGVITRYIYDASGNLLAEADEQNKITRYYIHGLGLLAMVTPSDADKVYCYHYNATGNTIAMTDANQQIVNKYSYSPFGIINNQQEAVPQPFKYVGQYGVMTEPNGLQYMRARYYDPQVGRFISEDPIGFAGGDVNLYVYCQNNPILYVDPNGNFNILGSAVGGVIGGIGGGLGAFFGGQTDFASIASAAAAGFVGGAVGGAFDVTAGVSAGIGAGIAAVTAAASGANPGGVLGAALGGGIGGALAPVTGGLTGVAVGTWIGGIRAIGYGMLGQHVYDKVSRDSQTVPGK